MAHLTGINIGNRARALAAALALGAAALSLMPGQTAYAARATSTEPGDPDAGAQQPATHRGGGSGTAARENLPRCSITSPDGHVELYYPGSEIVRDGRRFLCLETGEWMLSGRIGSDGINVGAGGVAPQAP